MNGDQALAEIWHEKHCHMNHTDMCGWGYESWTKPGWTRNRYLDAVRRLTDEERIAVENYPDFEQVMRR